MTKRPFSLLTVLCVAGCAGVIDGPVHDQVPGPTESHDLVTLPPAISLPAAVACDGKATGRSYRGFDGQPLDADRQALAAGQDLSRLRDGSDLFTEYDGHGIGLGSVSRSDMQAFGVSPDRWYEPTQASFATVYRAYALAFEGCLRQIKKPQPYHTFDTPDFQRSPTSETAQRQCVALGTVLWGRAMNDEELSACVDAAAEVLALVTDPQRQWASVCASVAGAVGFLIF